MKYLPKLSFICLCFILSISNAQIITLTFLGKDANSLNYLPLESVYIKNTTLDCDTIIYGETPSLVMTSIMGIEDPEIPGSASFYVFPPTPNPFSGSTSLQIVLKKGIKLRLMLADQKGDRIAEFENEFSSGLHLFEIRSSTNSLLILSVTDGNHVQSIKLLCNGDGNETSKIAYIGTADKLLKTGNTASGFIFQAGNQLLFKSFKAGYNEDIIIDSPVSNSSYTFQLILSPVSPFVTSNTITDIGQISAKGGGDVISDGGAEVIAKGVCWNTSPDPTIDDAHTIDGDGTGAFESILIGLIPGTVYYVKAYATNSAGTSYGNQIEFTTLLVNLPIVLTEIITDIDYNIATGGGDITSDGGAAISARGVCWDTLTYPTIENNLTSDGTGTGIFTSYLTGLTPYTQYYVRAYATNSAGTSYGNQESFTTPIECSEPFTVNHQVSGGVAPIDKSVTYTTVTNVSGELSKCWITSNLGADHQATAENDASEESAGWYWQFNRVQGYKHDGINRIPNTSWILLIEEYSNWLPENDPCILELKNGWRLPTYTELSNIELAGGWSNWLGPWNSFLKMHAAGVLSSTNGNLLSRGMIGYYWSSTQEEEHQPERYGEGLFFESDNCQTDYFWKGNGMSVRCVHD